VAIIVYVISFMDRTNIGFAFGVIGEDLHISAANQGLARGIFFIGYLVLQIPGGHWRSAGARRKDNQMSILPIWSRRRRVMPG
jgi:MFS family permease